MSKLKKIQRILDKEFGEQELKELKRLNKQQAGQIKETSKLYDISKKQAELLDKFISSNESLSKGVKELKDEMADKLEPEDIKELKSVLEDIKGKEFPEPKDEVKITNPVKQVDVNNLDKSLKKSSDSIIDGVGQSILKGLKATVKKVQNVFITNRDEKEYIPVRLVSKRGSRIEFDPPMGGGSSIGGPSTVDIYRPNQASDGLTETITTTAKQLAFSGGDLTIPSGTVSVTIQNASDNEVYLGESDVAAATSRHSLYNKGDSRTVNVQDGWSIYIVASASSQVNITFEKYV